MAVIQTDMFWEMHLENSGLKPFRDTLDQLKLTGSGTPDRTAAKPQRATGLAGRRDAAFALFNEHSATSQHRVVSTRIAKKPAFDVGAWLQAQAQRGFG